MKSPMTRGELRVIADTDHVQCGDAATMANMLLAEMDSEPVYQLSESWNGQAFTGWKDCTKEGFDAATPCGCERMRRVLYAAPPAPMALPDRERVRGEHAKWSQETFGNVGPIGPLKHLSKEALEAAADPGDLSEWADMQFLLWDAQRRAGITDEQITAALEEKLKVNMAREWPEPKDGEPRLHIKAAPEQEV
ncbi:DUF550 domain-containing protein [Kosakonia cowanii]|uniref:DUF550 domain-containing protein n=1 Tax=Kosakonia cowanii TaxID=208223 RepID=UPI003B21A6E2